MERLIVSIAITDHERKTVSVFTIPDDLRTFQIIDEEAVESNKIIEREFYRCYSQLNRLRIKDGFLDKQN